MVDGKYTCNIVPKEIVEKIIKSKNIILTTHINPDGDALGSILALSFMIDEYNKKYIINPEQFIKYDIVIDDILPKYMDKFPEKSIIKRVEEISKDKKYDLFISLDCANIERYGDSIEFKEKSNESINIDHHISNTHHGDFNYIENICSTCELLYQFIELFNIDITKKIAEYIYLGIINDTGNFRHDNVTENTFEVCSKLIKVGINNKEIANAIFSMSEKKIELLGDVYKNKVTNNKYKFRYYFLSQEKIKKYNLEKDDSDGISEILLKVENTELSLFIKEDETGELKGSFRANNKYNVNEIASMFNGGGHIKAAGFRTNLQLTEVIEMIHEYLEKNFSE